MRFLGTALLLLLIALPARGQSADRLYGRVATVDGDVFEGYIRWDKNEVSWVDLLDGTKHEVEDDFTRKHGERRVAGVRMDTRSRRSTDAAIRMGHIARLEPTGSQEALLTLRSGQRVTFRGGSSDIGTDLRELIVEDPVRGAVDLDWRDVETVDFSPAPRDATPSRYGERLYGRLTTRAGDVFTGFICWDVDEVFSEDELDGDDERGRRRSIPFGQIETIGRESSRSAWVRLTSGEELVLDGTNDVNSGNRDILVLDPALGQVRVEWDDFGTVDFLTPDYGLDLNDFERVGPLRGTVTTEDGAKYTGEIRWDADERYGWEMLNGEMDDVTFDVEFSVIARIDRLSSRGAAVTLHDGRRLELTGSNDVDRDNAGIYIRLANGDEVRVRWDDFTTAIFEKP